MAYNCVVLIKQVPDTKRITGKVMNDDGTVNRSALPAIFNPEDLNALELALQIKDEHGGHITVITMGPPGAATILRDSLFRGADEAILITDPRCAASDTLATSYILSCAARKCKSDIVLCGRQAIDGDTAQVGPQLAEKLGIPQITYVEQLMELDGNTITARRNIGQGWQQVRAKLPALLTVTSDANEPRVAAAKRMMKYKNARTPTEVERQIRGQNTEHRTQNTEDRRQKTEDSRQKTQGLAPTPVAGGRSQTPAPSPSASLRIDSAEATEDSEPIIKKLVDQQCEKLQQKGLLIKQWDLDFIGADLNWCGRSGSPTKVHRIQSVVLAAKESKNIEPSQQGISTLIHELIEDRIIA